MIESLLLGLLTVSLGASVGALAARGTAFKERALYAFDAWRARVQCDCYIAQAEADEANFADSARAAD